MAALCLVEVKDSLRQPRINITRQYQVVPRPHHAKPDLARGGEKGMGLG